MRITGVWRRLAGALLVLSLLIGSGVAQADPGGSDGRGLPRDLVVKVNGVPIEWDQGHKPGLYNGRTLVPLFKVVEATGDKVGWYDNWANGYEGLVIVERDLRKNPLPAGSVIPAHSGQYIRVKMWPRRTEQGGYPDRMIMEWTTPTGHEGHPGPRSMRIQSDLRLINDRTYVPVRHLMESLGYQVEWDEWSGSVNINTRAVQAPSESDFAAAARIRLRNLMHPSSGKTAFVIDQSSPIDATPATVFHLTRLLDQAGAIAHHSLDPNRAVVVMDNYKTITYTDKRTGRVLHEVHWTHGARRMTAAEAEHFIAELQDQADAISLFMILMGVVVGGAIDTKNDKVLDIIKNAGGAGAGYVLGKIIKSDVDDISLCYRAAKASNKDAGPNDPIITVTWVGNSLSRCFEDGHPDLVTLEELMEDDSAYYPGY
jgi:hypothetical protein